MFFRMSVIKYFLLIILIIFSFIPKTISRGPHHPRGQKIIEHHVHYRPTRSESQQESSPTKITQDTELLHDKEHLREDLDNLAVERDLSSMTDEELEFYYFQLHDFDNNTKLDGLEILTAIQHTSHESDDENDSEKDFQYFIELIDNVLEEDDVNHDGYLSYPEYVLGRIKDTNFKHAPKPNS